MTTARTTKRNSTPVAATGTLEHPPVPFGDDFAYLAVETTWVERRLQQLALEQPPSEEGPRGLRRGMGGAGIEIDEDDESLSRRQRRAESAGAAATSIRQRCDARLAVHRQAVGRGEAVELGLDRICTRFDLGEVERLTLLMAYALTARPKLGKLLHKTKTTVAHVCSVAAPSVSPRRISRLTVSLNDKPRSSARRRAWLRSSSPMVSVVRMG